MSAPLPSTIALGVLVALATVSPWAFGAVQPAAVQVLSLLALTTGVLVLVLGAGRGGLPLPAVPLRPLLALLGLVLLQLVPMPPALHRFLARGSHDVWHPAEPAAAAVLGSGARPISLDPDTTVRALGLLFGLVLLAVLAAPALEHRSAARRAVVLAVANGLALAVYGVWARSRVGALIYGRYAVPTVFPFGPFVSKNHFAGYAVLSALMALGLGVGLAGSGGGRRDWTTGARAGGVVLALVAAAGISLATLVSMSRGGVAALAAGLLVFAALVVSLRRPTVRLVPALAVALTLGALLFVALPDEAHERMRSAAGASFRLGVWKASLRLAGKSPLVGTGLGSFHDALPRYKQAYGELRVSHAENDYLETLAETGGLGLGLVLAGAGLLYASAWRGLRRATPLLQGLGLGALAGLAGLAVHSGVDFNLRIPSNAALAALLAAIAAAVAGMRPRSLSVRGSIVLAASASFLVGALVVLPESPSVRARERVREAALATTPEAQALRLDRAEAALRRAVGWRPAQGEAWLQLAAVRAARGDAASAAGLARHAATLDPERADLRARARALEEGKSQ